MWIGKEAPYTGDKCPICGAEIEEVEDPPIWEYFGDFNWNKK